MTATPPPPRPRFRIADQAWLLLMLPPLFWAGNAVLGRAVAGDVPPVGLAFWRWTVGTAVLLPFAWRHLRADRSVLLAHWRTLLLLTVVGISLFNTMMYLGLETTTAVNAVMLQTAMPVLIVLMSFAFFRDRVTAAQALGILVSIAGALVLIAHGDPATLLGLAFNMGDLYVLIAVICYAAYTALLRRRPKVHAFSFITVIFGLGALTLLPFYLLETAGGRPMPLSAQAVLAVGYVSLLASILAYLCYNRVVLLLGANTAGLSIHLVPVFGSLLAIAFLGESLHLYHAVGIALIAGGIVLATRRRAAA